MTFWIKPHLAIFIPIYVITLWLVIPTILGFLSGWFRLMRVFPDLPEVASLRLRFQSGAMGPGVAMNGILVLSVCPSGLRVGTMQIFSPFNRDFLVPWQSIAVIRKNFPFWPTAKLQFGNPAVGTLTISAHLADRLARAAMADWPESEPFADYSSQYLVRRLLVQWAITTCAGAAFFVLVPRLVSPRGAHPPTAFIILFPAIAGGCALLIRYFLEKE